MWDAIFLYPRNWAGLKGGMIARPWHRNDYPFGNARKVAEMNSVDNHVRETCCTERRHPAITQVGCDGDAEQMLLLLIKGLAALKAFGLYWAI